MALRAVARRRSHVAEAHALGLRVVPYTIDARDDIAAAATAGVDALITNDPLLARRTEGELEAQAGADPAAAEQGRLPRRARAPQPGHDRGSRSRRHGLRVFAMQFKQDLRHVVTYGSFRTKIECMIREYVVPRLARRGARTSSRSTRTSG